MMHEAFDAATARRLPLGAQGRVDTGRAISSPMCRMDPSDLGQQGAIGHLTRAFGPATPGIIPRRRDTHRIAHDANRERLALIFDEAEFHLGASEKMRSVFLESPVPCASVRSRAAGGRFRPPDLPRQAGSPLRIGAPRRSCLPPVTLVPPGAQHRGRNPQLPGDLAQRPPAARQQLYRLPLEFIREVDDTSYPSNTSCSLRSLQEVSTISREGHTSGHPSASRSG